MLIFYLNILCICLRGNFQVIVKVFFWREMLNNNLKHKNNSLNNCDFDFFHN